MTKHQEALSVPKDTEAEKSLLGSLLLDPRLIDDVVPIVDQEDFYDSHHATIWSAMVEMHQRDRRIDSQLLIGDLKKSNRLESAGGLAYLMEVLQAVPVAAHCEHYAGLVREAAILRGLYLAGQTIVNESVYGSGDAGARLDRAEERILSIQDRRVGESLHEVSDVIPTALKQLQDRLDGFVESPSVRTGFADLDALVNLRPGDLVVLAARPSMGKTALALQAALNAANQAMAALFVSLEMSRGDLCDRLMSSVGGVPLHAMREGSITPQQRKKLVASSAEMLSVKLFIDDSPSRTVNEIAACARRLKRKNKLGLVVIDYLQLITPDNGRDPREQQVATISKRLKCLARQLAVPVVCLAQLNRQNESQGDKRPKLSHLRESGSIEQDADVVLFVHREEYYLPPKAASDAGVEGIAEILVGKQRNGPTGIVKLGWQREYTRFVNLAVGQDEGKEWNPNHSSVSGPARS